MTKIIFSIRAIRTKWRAILFVGVVLYLCGYPIYIYLDSVIAGGVWQRGELYVVDLKAMSDFTLDQINGTSDQIPERFRKLDGQRVQLTGEMWTSRSAGDKIGEFQLVYSISKCCFSGPPLIQHFVQATVKHDREVRFQGGLVNVIGTLHVGVVRGDGRVESVYRVEVERIDPA